MKHGDTYDFKGEELVARYTANGSCQDGPLNCAMYIPNWLCRGRGGDYLPCANSPVIFLTRQKFAELRLMGEA